MTEGQRAASGDRVARILAALALAAALGALFMAAHAVSLGERYLHEVEVLGEGLRRSQETPAASLERPPLELAD